MKFREDGAEVPQELIDAVTIGDAVFLCGAGISMRLDLPSFHGLTEQVYARLGETVDNEPAERRAFDRGEFDRALRSLEKRIHQPKAPQRVRQIVADILMAKAIPAPDHLALLRLSSDRDGRPRILTTNFDTYFERAASEANMLAPSHAGKAIPKPGGLKDFGILHIHGRLGDPQLGLAQSDLILTSADFGDAYLRDGWASQYVEDRMRINTLALVGYAAEDPALRLLLETLDADRERFRDLKQVYALEKQTDGSASLWRAKGIRPIEFEDYDQIYSTIREWAVYSEDPEGWTEQRAIKIFGSSDAKSDHA